jgi:hypothetical protein
MDFALSPAGERFRQELGDDFFITNDRGIVLGPPAFVQKERARELTEFSAAYHRCLETVVQASREDARVREVLALPGEMREDLSVDDDPLNGRVHLFRLDLLLDEEGGFQVLESNANCPGGILYTGIAARGWRTFLESQGHTLPPPLPHEDLGWMARWFIDAAEKDGAGRPEVVALLREEGGNSIELREFAEAFAEEGVDAFQADPRQMEWNSDGSIEIMGRPVRHAYLKLGLQPYLRMRRQLDVFVDAVRNRQFFVQNGMRGRWVGDSKLALAVLSDPDFAHLFDADDLAILGDHIPWSRNMGLCSYELVDRVRAERGEYVLKRGLDTRGRGVVVGRAVDEDREWDNAVDVAIREGWLVQRFCDTTVTLADFDTPIIHRHDLAIGIIEGEVGAMFMRSSGEYKVNVAQNGRLHPVFVAD